ncbi:MAG: hypothetical protein ABIK45_08170 [Pseudomonadota bacterium]
MPRHELAKLCGTTKSSLDRALRKFGFKGLVTYTNHNSSMGNRGTVITWTGDRVESEASGDTASHRLTQRHSDTPGDTAMRCVTHRPPLLERKKEDLSLYPRGESEEESPRGKLLALTGEDFETFWPHLANLPKGGFGVKQVRQLVDRLTKVDTPLDGIMQSLHHAEFAVKNGLARDKTGKPVEGAGYFFNAFLADGFYDRPPSYLSPRERALKAREEELAREKEAAARVEEAAFQSWMDSLSDEEKAEILAANRMPGPERAKLYKAYRERKT